LLALDQSALSIVSVHKDRVQLTQGGFFSADGWYRTSFNLRLPENADVPIGIQINDTTSSAYRALIFVNGWQMGIYVNNLGPQKIFPIPAGILNPNGENTVAIAVWGEQNGSGGLGAVTLFQYGNFSGGVPIEMVPAPPAMH
jgi:Beta-galactosidase jelly roll domain